MDFTRNGDVPSRFDHYDYQEPIKSSLSPPQSPLLEERGKTGNKVKRTPSEQRMLDADIRAKLVQDKLRALELEADKAKAVIAQRKVLSSASVEGFVVDGKDNTQATSMDVSATLVS
jgi:hypothetical protein